MAEVNISSCRNFMSSGCPGTQISNDVNTGQFVSDMNMGNIAAPDHIRRLRHDGSNEATPSFANPVLLRFRENRTSALAISRCKVYSN